MNLKAGDIVVFPLSRMAAPASEKYMALVGMVALLTAGMLLVARIFKLGFLADFLSRTVLSGFSPAAALEWMSLAQYRH